MKSLSFAVTAVTLIALGGSHTAKADWVRKDTSYEATDKIQIVIGSGSAVLDTHRPSAMA